MFTPDLKSTPSMLFAFHQSQATLPGLIHEVSCTCDGFSSSQTSWLVIRSPSFSAMPISRQGYVRVPLVTAM